MLFRRRSQPPFPTRLREALSPRKGWRRGLDYGLQRLRRLQGRPDRIALGVAIGTFVSFSPFYTLHIPLTLGLCWLTGGSLLGGFAGTFVANALTTPPIAIAAIVVGDVLLGRDGAAVTMSGIAAGFVEAFGGLWAALTALFTPEPARLADLAPFFREIFLPYLAGGTLLGLLAAGLAYALSVRIIQRYRARRIARLEAQARLRPRSDAPAAAQEG